MISWIIITLTEKRTLSGSHSRRGILKTQEGWLSQWLSQIKFGDFIFYIRPPWLSLSVTDARSVRDKTWNISVSKVIVLSDKVSLIGRQISVLVQELILRYVWCVWFHLCILNVRLIVVSWTGSVSQLCFSDKIHMLVFLPAGGMLFCCYRGSIGHVASKDKNNRNSELYYVKHYTIIIHSLTKSAPCTKFRTEHNRTMPNVRAIYFSSWPYLSAWAALVEAWKYSEKKTINDKTNHTGWTVELCFRLIPPVQAGPHPQHVPFSVIENTHLEWSSKHSV